MSGSFLFYDLETFDADPQRSRFAQFAAIRTDEALEEIEAPIDFLVKVRKVALPLYPQAGTEPNVYYIPPMHAGRDYLHQMFGPGADEAIRTYQNTKNDPELLGLMMLFGSSERIMHRFRVEGETAIGMDENGAELVRVPVREPSWVRTYFDEVRGTYNHNIS